MKYDTVCCLHTLEYISFKNILKWDEALYHNYTAIESMRSKKVKISVSLDANLIDWVDKKVDDFTFQNRSDGLEKAVYKLKTDLDRNKETPH